MDTSDGAMGVHNGGVPLYSADIYSSTKCVGSPGIIQDRMPDFHPVS